MDTRGFLAQEGYPFILVALLLFVAAFVFRFYTAITILFFVLFLFTAAFFRDPQRPCAGQAQEILSPADGRIVKITRNEDDRFLGGPSVQVGIFMSPLNVHVNRSPLAGTVEDVRYNPGRYVNASLDKASLDNEQNALIVKTDLGPRIAVNQIAGFIARRIVCRVGRGAHLDRGERFGLIRFGSRVDLHLPADATITCQVGDRVYGGDTILGVIENGASAQEP